MLNDNEVIETAHQRINDALMVTSWWRANEIRDNYNLIEGDQWLEEPYDRQNADGMPIRTINKLAPVIDSICGFEIQNRSEVKYIPRLSTSAQIGFTDMLNDAVKYIQDEAQSEFQNSQAFRDMLICGVGVTDTIISYDNNFDGEVKIERVFPYLTLWDVTARAKNLEDANWVIRAKIVDKDSMDGYLKDAADNEQANATFGAAVDARFLDFFNTVMIAKSLGIIYEYQWRDKVPFYRIENPFVNITDIAEYQNPYELLELAKALQEKYNIDPAQDRVFSIESEDFSKLKQLFELLALPFKYTKQKKFKYYRAILVGNKIIEKSENYSQKSFSLKFMTGKFSEVRQCYYGIIRGSKEPQRLLNQAVSDYEGFLRTIPKGGVEIEADAVPNMEAFVQTYTKAREVTIYNPGGLAKTRPKITPPIPAGLLDMINFATTAIMETTGVTQDFMGITDSKMMTATLNRQLVRQGLTTLSSYFDAKKFYTIAQGKLFIDCVRILVENSEGRLIRVMQSDSTKYYAPLLKNGLAAEYDVVVEAVPATPSERQDTFEKLLQLAGLLANTSKPVDITPIALQYSPLKEEQIKEILQMMQPPPPPQPDPLAQQILVAETQLKQATAEKNSADAAKTTIEAMLKRQELEHDSMLKKAQIEKLLSDVRLNNAKTTSEITNTIMENINGI